MLRAFGVFPVVTVLLLFIANLSASQAQDNAAEIDQQVDSALATLTRESDAAANLAKTAKGILVFPKIIKAGLLVGGQYGKGALRVNNETAGYYETVAASYGLQAGVQSFGYALFIMSDEAFEYLNRSDGWEIGVGPSVVVVDEGLARTLTTTTTQEGIYAFIFGQKGLMAGLGIQGSKITKIESGSN